MFFVVNIIYVAHWVILFSFCLPQTFHIFFVCAFRGFLFDMILIIYCNKMFLFMPVQAAGLHGGFQSRKSKHIISSFNVLMNVIKCLCDEIKKRTLIMNKIITCWWNNWHGNIFGVYSILSLNSLLYVIKKVLMWRMGINVQDQS